MAINAVERYQEIQNKCQPFIENPFTAKALDAAFRIGLIDQLQSLGVCRLQDITDATALEMPAGMMLLSTLHCANIISWSEPTLRLSQSFADALKEREFLQGRLEFSLTLAGDYFQHLQTLITNFSQYTETSALFSLFDYESCRHKSPSAAMNASNWMRYTTLLTRFEAPPLLESAPLEPDRITIDIGGNSGEFALKAKETYPNLRIDVVDLPAPCQVGRAHVAQMDPTNSIRFIEADLRYDPLPDTYNCHIYKSVLHDWPDEDAARFLQKSHEALPSGGRILILERIQWNPLEFPPDFLNFPIYLFYRYYRNPSFYLNQLQKQRWQNITIKHITLDFPFMIISALK